MDDKARLSLDMIIGVSIFLFVFIYVAQFLPSVFADVRSEISLSHEAYKVAVMLAEDPGRWDNGSMNGTGWESYWDQSEYPDIVFRPGLAFSKDTPCYLSYNKIKAFQRAVDQNYTRIKEYLGLKTPDNDYEFNVSLQTLNSKPYRRELIQDWDGNYTLNAGRPLITTQVARFERIVWIDDIEAITGNISIDTDKGAYPTSICSGSGTGLNCSFSYTYPLTMLVVDVLNQYQPSPKVSLCLDVGSCTSGSCRIGGPNKLCLNNNSICESLENKRYDLVDLANQLLSNAGAKNGDEICIKVSVRDVNVKLYTSDTIDYIAGNPTAKLVVVVWR
ncbi:hypothetical protein DRP05_07340 [Archaeoglobales archaeon]|nr:MAG: hypothetical protein DRP05_07340 [Archaeoglobales archaeon]